MEMKAPATIPYFLQEQIREMIIEGTFLPGQPLREQELEQRFGTSRSPIREALRLLELSGLVTHAQRRGFRVTLYSEREIRHLYLLRAELEAYSIMQLAEFADLAPLIAELETCNASLSRFHAAGAVRDYLAQLRYFFGSIVRYTQNNALIEALGKLTEQSEPLRYSLLKRDFANSRPGCTNGILEALSRRNFGKAASLKREHVLSSLPLILQAYAGLPYPDAANPPGGASWPMRRQA